MKEKNRFLYNATAHIDEKLIDGLIGEDRTPQSAAPEKGRRTPIKKTLVAALAAALAVSLFAGGIFVWQNRKPEPNSGRGTTVEPFKGTPGNYAGAKFMSLADTSVTRDSQQYGSSYLSYTPDHIDHINSIGAFFDRITESLLSGKENAVVSPVNIYMALSLLAESTGGTSRRQILDVIGVPGMEELREQSKWIWIQNSYDNEYGRSLLANSVWLSGDLSVKEACVKLLNDDHFASVFAGDFSDDDYKNALKQWLSDQTKGLLDNCVNALEIPDSTAAALASTLYYKTRWNDGYEKTEKGTFKGAGGDQKCVFNVKTVKGAAIYETDRFTAYREMLSDGNAMWFFLPNEGSSVEDVLKADLASFASHPKDARVHDFNVTVRMPDYDVDFNRSILEDLKKLGVTDCADAAKADFSPLTDARLCLGNFIHAARFKADKEGVEGAAYSIQFLDGAGPIEDPPYDFTLDRPFVFMVVHGGVPTFVGTVTEL